MDEPKPEEPAAFQKLGAILDDWLAKGGWPFLLEEGHDPRNYYGRLVPARPLLLRALGIPK